MPDDSVFETPAAGSENIGETTEVTQTPVPAAGVTQEQLDAKFAPIEKSLSEMSNFFTKLEQQATTTPAGPIDPPKEGDFPTRFYEDPEGTVEDKIRSEAAPILQQNATFAAKVLMDKQQEAIDGRWGVGTWAEEFEPVLAPIVADAIQKYPTSLSNPTAVQNAVDTIKGQKFEALTARAAKLAEGAPEDPNKEIVDQVFNRVNQEMTGGLRRVNPTGGEKLDDDDSKDFLRKFFEKTGEEIDSSRLSKLMGTGDTYEDWKKATKEDK